MLRQERAGLAVILRRLVMTFAQTHDRERREGLLDDVEKAHLALLVRPVAAAPRDQRDLASPLTDEPANQEAGGAAGGPIVEPHIGGALRAGDVGDQRQDRDAAAGDLGDRIAHQRMIECHEGDAVGAARVMAQALCQCFRIEPLNEIAVAGNVESHQLVVRGRDMLAEHA
jgi:hypothetical protein